jgi:phosphate:Na+ symporter
VLLIGFTATFARFATWLVPDLPQRGARVLAETRYLDPDVLETPAIALEHVRWELGEMGALVVDMLRRVRPALRDEDLEALETIVVDEERVDQVHHQILQYLARLREGRLTAHESKVLHDLNSIADHLEHVADVVSKDMVKNSYRAIDAGLAGGENLRHILGTLYETTIEALEKAIQATRDDDEVLAEEVIAMKARFARLVKETLEVQAETLSSESAGRLDIFRIEMEAVDDLRRVYTVARRTAKVQLPDS